MDISDLHAPLRAKVSRYELIESLYVIFNYTQLLQFKRQLNANIQANRKIISAHRLKKGFFEWELDLLALEVLQKYPSVGPRASLRNWSEFSDTINSIKRLEEKISERAGDELGKTIWLELGRIAHRQFPWQTTPNHRTLARYYKIFSRPKIDEILTRKVGLTVREFYLLGMVFLGHFLREFLLDFPVDPTPLGLTREQLAIFIRKFGTPLSNLITIAEHNIQLNENFAFSQNPLKIYPLVHAMIEGRHRLIAPMPTHLFHRFTDGMFYELVGEPGFDNEFGASFQAYVGDVLLANLPDDRFKTLSEQAFYIGKDKKDSIDWLASDHTAHLFIECKTKRIRLSSKFDITDTKHLKEDADKLASFIVQTYKTLRDALNGHYPHWKTNNKPIYPIIVTLEDWYTISPVVTEMIEAEIKRQFDGIGINHDVIKEHPYTIASCSDLELLIPLIGRLGIESVMSLKATAQKRLWNVSAVLHSEFRKEIGKLDRDVFRDDLREIHPAMADDYPDIS